MIKFELFSRLYCETAGYTNVDMYISERGWQSDFMDELDDAGIDVGKLLISVWELKHSDIAQLRKRSGLSKGEFSGRYGIPYRTVQNWEAEGTEHRDPPEYLKMLIAYTMLEV